MNCSTLFATLRHRLAARALRIACSLATEYAQSTIASTNSRLIVQYRYSYTNTYARIVIRGVQLVLILIAITIILRPVHLLKVWISEGLAQANS